MRKRIFAVVALVTSITGIFAATAAPPASAASICVTITVTVTGTQVIPTTRICLPPQ